MYNKNQKVKYLDSCHLQEKNGKKRWVEGTIDLMKKAFANSKAEEEHLDKDISMFNEYEISDFLKSLNSKSPRVLQKTCRYLSEYCIWCIEKEFIKEDNFNRSITDELINTIIPKERLNKSFFTKTDMIAYLDNIKDVSNKFISYAIYNGIKGEDYNELVNLKICDLNHKTRTVKLISGREVPIDDLFIKLMEETNEKKLYFDDGIERESKRKRYNYTNTEFVIKNTAKNNTGPVKRSYITHRLSVIANQSENEFISESTLYLNGLINYIKERYAELEIDLHTALCHRINKKHYTYDKDTQKYIDAFGSSFETKMIRFRIKEYLNIFMEETYDEKKHYDEYVNEIDRLMGLDDLDLLVQGIGRKEQSFLRKKLFNDNDFAICGICGNVLPVNLLVTAHIKKRSDCTKEERLDIENNIMPMCKMGCDDLFEKGFIYVEDGLIKKYKNLPTSKIVDEYIKKFENMKCTAWTSKSKKYFEHHKNSHNL